MNQQQKKAEDIIKESINKNSRLINLANLELEHLPECINDAQMVQVLNLRGNRFTEVPNLSKFKKLEVLYLDKNRIRTIDFISNLESLKVLDLSNNEIENIPESITSLKKLKRLFLSNNRIIKIPEIIGELSSLEYLIFCENEISFIPLSVELLQNAIVLNFSNNKISSVEVDFGKLTNLRRLYLSENRLIQYPRFLNNSKSLQYIQLFSNRIKGTIEIEQFDLSNLIDLNLANNEIERVRILRKKENEFKRVHLYFNSFKENQLGGLTKCFCNEILILKSDANKFILNQKTIQGLKIIDDGKGNLNTYKTVPYSIIKEYNLKDRRMQLKDRWKNKN